MEFQITDLINRRTRTVKVSAVGGKVEIGHHPKADVRLDGPPVGELLGAFQNNGSGQGWQFFNFNGRTITVVDQVPDPDGVREEVAQTWEPFHYVPVVGRVVELRHPPEYLIRVRFEPHELTTEADDTRRLDLQAAELVISIHRELNRLLSGPGVAAGDPSSSEYIHALERRVEDLTKGRTDFPDDDSASTTVGDHLAGTAVRAEVIHRLSADAGEQIQKLRSRDQIDSWAELRIRDHDREENLKRLVSEVIPGLGLDGIDDLTAQMTVIKERFWSYWYDLLKGKVPGRSAPSTQLRRYLALRRLRQEIKALWYGFGPLEDLLDDPTITEIMVVDKDHIFVEKGSQIEDSGVRFLDDSTTLAVIEKVAATAGRVLNEELPLLDAMMPDGSRVNAVHPSLALRGPALTIRRFPRKRITIDILVDRYKSLSRAARNFLEAAVINRRNILVAGGTGTGKTTLLNCLSGFIPDKERIITIEDTAELQLQKTHVVTLQTRKKTSNDGDGREVSIQDLVRNSLRMKPDRIVVGECRGPEGLDMLKAMNTGHDGSLTTLHANTPRDAVLRLVGMCLEANKELPVASINRMVASAVDLIVQLRVVTVEGRDADGNPTRRKGKLVSEIAELEGVGDDGEVVIRPLFVRDGAGPLRPTGALPSFLPELLEDPRVKDLVRSPLDLVREADGVAT